MKQSKSYWLTLLTGLAVCCAVKLVLLSGGLGFLAGILTGQGWWLILGGGLLLLGAGWWWFRRRRKPREDSSDETGKKGTACSSQRSERFE
jgi:LPXTG-motif cell wall-anchored protein